MPPKGWKSGRDDTVLKTVRLPEPIMDRVLAHVDRMQATFTFARITESMALRNLIELGLGVAEGPPQPAIPLAMEPAPKATVSPMEPQVDAPLVTHETRTPSEEADQEPAPAAELPLAEPPTGVQTERLPEPREPVPQTGHIPDHTTPAGPGRTPEPPTGMQVCTKDPSHPPYKLSLSKCPLCRKAENSKAYRDRQKQKAP
jgi:hypothetical protein